MATAKEPATKITVAQAKKKITDLENKIQTLKDGAWCHMCDKHKSADAFYISTADSVEAGYSNCFLPASSLPV